MTQKCLSCGATLKKGSFVCDYCGSDWTPDEILRQAEIRSVAERVPHPFDQKEKAAKPANHALRVLLFIGLFFTCAPLSLIFMWLGLAWKKSTKIAMTVFVLTPLVAFLIFGLVYETVYSVKAETPKIDSTAPPPDERPHSNISMQRIHAEVFNKPNLELAARKKIWRDSFPGLWVKWSGKISQVSIYTTTQSELTLEPLDFTGLKIKVYFDPLQNTTLERLSPGEKVMVSGRLWGINLFDSQVLLADGALLGPAEAK